MQPTHFKSDIVQTTITPIRTKNDLEVLPHARPTQNMWSEERPQTLHHRHMTLKPGGVEDLGRLMRNPHKRSGRDRHKISSGPFKIDTT